MDEFGPAHPRGSLASSLNNSDQSIRMKLPKVRRGTMMGGGSGSGGGGSGGGHRNSTLDVTDLDHERVKEENERFLSRDELMETLELE